MLNFFLQPPLQLPWLFEERFLSLFCYRSSFATDKWHVFETTDFHRSQYIKCISRSKEHPFSTAKGMSFWFLLGCFCLDIWRQCFGRGICRLIFPICWMKVFALDTGFSFHPRNVKLEFHTKGRCCGWIQNCCLNLLICLQCFKEVCCFSMSHFYVARLSLFSFVAAQFLQLPV